MSGKVRSWFSLATIVLAGLMPAVAAADPVADFYRGKDLRLIISSSVGGGYDVYARTIAKHLADHLAATARSSPQCRTPCRSSHSSAIGRRSSIR
jgi:hypothetical protein